MKVGDPVIVYKPIWMDNKPKSGKLVEIFELDNRASNYTTYRYTIYRVYFYDKSGRWLSGCNIFTHQNETIELDIECMRDLKIKELGI